MTRHIPRYIVVASVVFTLFAPQAGAKDKKADELKKKLERKVTLETGIKANTSLRTALCSLKDRYDFRLGIDMKTFQRVGIDDILDQPVKLAKQVQVPLETVLQRILDQVNATYNIEGHTIWVVSKMRR